MLHVSEHDSVYSKSEECTAHQNSVYICGPSVGHCSDAAPALPYLTGLDPDIFKGPIYNHFLCF